MGEAKNGPDRRLFRWKIGFEAEQNNKSDMSFCNEHGN